MKRGRKPFLAGSYERVAERLKALGVEAPSFEAYAKMPCEARRVLERLALVAGDGGCLPSRFNIEGDWVTAVVYGDGKRILVYGRNLKVREESA
jgi:hypothetical protein